MHHESCFAIRHCLSQSKGYVAQWRNCAVMEETSLFLQSEWHLNALCGKRNNTLNDVSRRTNTMVVRDNAHRAIHVRSSDKTSVDAAIRMLRAHLEHVQNPVLASYKPTFLTTCPRSKLGLLVGRGWAHVKRLEESFGCGLEVRVVQREDICTIAIVANDRRTVTLAGKMIDEHIAQLAARP